MSITSLVGKMFGAGDSVEVGPADGSAKQRPTKEGKRLQYCETLRTGSDADSKSIARSWKWLDVDMALVPSGSTALIENWFDGSVLHDGATRLQTQRLSVEPFYIDRFAVSNSEYAQFVKAGGYDDIDLWEPDVLSHLLGFVDQTGQPGPLFWQYGRPPRDQSSHPVVGICWFEANAYCRWVGKYLPSSAQWQRAASWHTIKSDGECAQKYPWGDTFDKNLANCWSSGVGQTVPVDHYYNGCTPNGVYQLIGNTWEWLSGRFVETVQPGQKTSGLSEIRGGAFDTYLESQLTCQFRTGQPLLCRSANTGFRCVIGKDQIQSPTPTNE